ncbi:MAG: PDZ domain-containing protein [Alphaproteobacteria bacterium]|nr:PDZ domain-containing protein [Alphaproteobacteria bacterium]
MLALWAGWHLPEDEVVVVHAPLLVVTHEGCVVPAGAPVATRDVRADLPDDLPGWAYDSDLPEPPSVVYCPLPAAVVALAPLGTVRLHRPGGSLFDVARFEQGALAIFPMDDVTGGDVQLDGYAAATLTLADGVCTVGPLVPQASITGGIVPTAGAEAGQVVVQGCGVNVVVDPYGTFFARVDPGPCTLVAVRQDGRLSVRSAPLELDLAPGEDVDVELALPTWHAASVGVALAADDNGRVVVREVADGGPGDGAGLRAGDVVGAIDGVRVRADDGEALWDAVDRALGPAGTEVTYTVWRDGERVDVTAVREVE